jgi:hypothetical protein
MTAVAIPAHDRRVAPPDPTTVDPPRVGGIFSYEFPPDLLFVLGASAAPTVVAA